MKDIVAGAPYSMYVDRINQKLYAVGTRTNVIDLNTLTICKRLTGFRYIIKILFIHKFGWVFLATNNDECWLLNIDDYSVVHRFKYRILDPYVCFDEVSDKIYVFGTIGIDNGVSVIDLKTLTIENYCFPRIIDEKRRRLSFYSPHKCAGEDLYLLNCSYDILPTSTENVETIYGKYRLSKDGLQLIDTIYTGNEDIVFAKGNDDYMLSPIKGLMYRVKENDVIDYGAKIGELYYRFFISDKYIYFWEWFSDKIIRTTVDFDSVETVFTKGFGEKVASYAESEKYRFVAVSKCDEYNERGVLQYNVTKSRIMVFDKNEEMKSSAICMKGR